jgi:hypothetical protein
MTTLENTKPQSTEINSANDATRCQHRRPSGRRCKLTVTSLGAPFCFTHTQEFNKADSLNLKTALLTRSQGFQTAQGINYSLSNLYILLANNYISPRRAAVLAYINSLLLRTLPAISADNEAGFTDSATPEESTAHPAASPSDVSPSAEPGDSVTPNWATEPDPTKKPS